MRKRKYFEWNEESVEYNRDRVSSFYRRPISERTKAFEMATLRKSRSGLPVNIYLDDSGSYIDGGHGPMIKFQPDKGDSPNMHSMIPMTISDNPTIPIKNYQLRLKGVDNKDISHVKSFVIANKVSLLRLCDRNDEYDIFNFLEDMIKAVLLL